MVQRAGKAILPLVVQSTRPTLSNYPRQPSESDAPQQLDSEHGGKSVVRPWAKRDSSCRFFTQHVVIRSAKADRVQSAQARKSEVTRRARDISLGMASHQVTSTRQENARVRAYLHIAKTTTTQRSSLVKKASVSQRNFLASLLIESGVSPGFFKNPVLQCRGFSSE